MPSLLYLADVPVEKSYHGSALLYRLLTGYPTNRLAIVETTTHPSLPERRLPDVSYHQVIPGWPRLLNTRAHAIYSAWLHYKFSTVFGRLGMPHVRRPQAILTVVHGYGWLFAAQLSRLWKIPLHLIIHDDWPRTAQVPVVFRQWLEEKFRNVYRQATSRMCVSSEMAAAYRAECGVPGDVLYPSRSEENPVFAPEEDLVCSRPNGPTVAFAGNLNSLGYIRALRLLAGVLQTMGGRLLLFGPLEKSDLVKMELDLPNVEMKGLLPSSQLIPRLHQEADVLFVPMSFDDHDRSNMIKSFPSKLADYTAAARPLLVFGPKDCTAVVWAQQHPGVAEVVTEDRADALLAGCSRILTDSGYRRTLTEKAVRIGEESFSAVSARRSFYHLLERRHLA